MLCAVKDCYDLAKYVWIFIMPDGRKLKYNFCEECNKLDWHTVGDGAGIIPLDKKDD